MKNEFEFIRLVGGQRLVGPTLESVSRHWQGVQERFLFISPHDDDSIEGAGLLIQSVLQQNVPVYILVVTDGSMGYCSAEEKNTIVEIRRKETFQCYQSIGLPEENIICLGFPDCQLHNYLGRRPAGPDDKVVIAGFTGLQNALTHYLRKIKPTQCFMPTSNDLHPDHKMVHETFLICMYHAMGIIWPELGEPIQNLPHVSEVACYCNFPQPPQLRISSSAAVFERKMSALAAFRSQKQIEVTVNNLRKGGPQEYIRQLAFKLYDPREYESLFGV